MYNKNFSHRPVALSAMVLLVVAGCDLRKFESTELYRQNPQEYSDQVFAASEDFALGKISAPTLRKMLAEITADPKRLSQLVAKKIIKDGPLKGYGLAHLLVRGLASVDVAEIFKALLPALGGDAISIITTLAQGQSVFDVLRNQLIRPKNELSHDNLLVVHALLNYDPELINHASLSFAEKNQLFLMDNSRALNLFKAMDADNKSAWDIAADANYAAVKEVLATLMQQMGREKIVYKNKILRKEHIKFLESFQEYGFNHDDLIADDFVFESGPQGRFLTVYAYRLGDICAHTPEKHKKYLAVVKIFMALFGDRQSYVKYASDESVKDILWDPGRSSAFKVTKPAIDSEAAALHVLGLLDADLTFGILKKFSLDPRETKAEAALAALGLFYSHHPQGVVAIKNKEHEQQGQRYKIIHILAKAEPSHIVAQALRAHLAQFKNKAERCLEVGMKMSSSTQKLPLDLALAASKGQYSEVMQVLSNACAVLEPDTKNENMRPPRRPSHEAQPPLLVLENNMIEPIEHIWPEPQPDIKDINILDIGEIIIEPVVEEQVRPLVQVKLEPIPDSSATNSPNMAGANKAQQSPHIAKAFNIFNNGDIHSDASNAHFLQQVKEIIVIDTKIADGVRSKALDSLDYLRKLATAAWSELVRNNPANEVLTIFERKRIHIHEKSYELWSLTASPTKDVSQFSTNEEAIDDKGQKIKAMFRGIISGSRMGVLVSEAEKYLSTCTDEEFKFLASQKYFWTDLLNNLPDIFKLLSPSQIQAMSTVMANENLDLRDEALAVLQRLIKHLDISEDPEVIEKISALVPAAFTALFEKHLEDRLREKLGAIKIEASRTSDEHKWHLADAQIQRLDYIVHERKIASLAYLPKPQDFDDAMLLIAGLVTIKDGYEFQRLMHEFLPSGHDHEVGNALYLLSNDYNHLKDLLFVFTGQQVQRIFIISLAKTHQRSSKQTLLVKNLIRGLEPENADFVMLIQTILAKIEEINGYPDSPEDLPLLEETWESFQGPLNSALKRYDQKAGLTYSAHEKFDLMAKFDFIKKRLAAWRQHQHDASNVEILAKLKLQMPKLLEAPEGNFGLQGSRQTKELLISDWYSHYEVQKYLTHIKNPSFYPISEDEQNDARAFLSQILAQAPFLDSNQQEELKKAFGQLLSAHSIKMPLLDFVYEVKTEHEGAALMDLLPNDPSILSALVRYFNFGDNVSQSTFMRIQQLGKFVFRYLSKSQLDILIKDLKFWELLGAQATVAGLALEPWAFEALTTHLLDNYQSCAEQNFARVLSKIDIYDQRSAARAYDRLKGIAERAQKPGVLTLLKAEISRKTNALQQFLAIDARARVRELKKMLK